MSWAPRRMTSREEDVAYCLMGIFGINMPMLYGEGSRAFIRLQEEIIRSSTDQSIFAWELVRSEYLRAIRLGLGLLAGSPEAFRESGDIVQSNLQGGFGFSLTSHGLSLRLPMTEIGLGEMTDPKIEVEHNFIAILDCQRSNEDSHVLGIGMEKVTGTSQHFLRSGGLLVPVKKREVNLSQSNVSDVYVRQPRQQSKAPVYREYRFETFCFKENGLSELDHEYFDHDVWNPGYHLYSGIAAVRYAGPDGTEFVVILQHKGGEQYIEVVEPVDRSKTLQEVVGPFRYKAASKVPADRMKGQPPVGD